LLATFKPNRLGYAKSLPLEVVGKAAVPQTEKTHGKVLPTPLTASWDRL
jgi:hypothetical protein